MAEDDPSEVFVSVLDVPLLLLLAESGAVD